MVLGIFALIILNIVLRLKSSNLGDTTGAKGGHGGGDLRLSDDFVEFVGGGKPSISCTQLADSINGHLIVFAADEALKTRKRLVLKEYFDKQ